MEEDTKKYVYWAIPAVVAVGIGVALYYGRAHRQAEQEAKQTPAVTQPQSPPPSAEPPIKNPVAETPAVTRFHPPDRRLEPCFMAS